MEPIEADVDTAMIEVHTIPKMEKGTHLINNAYGKHTKTANLNG